MSTLDVGEATGRADQMKGSESVQVTLAADDGPRTAADKVGDLAAQARDRVGELGGQVAGSAGAAMTATGQQMRDAAGALGRGGDYLRRSDLDAVREDVRGAVRRHPRPALAVGVGVGLLGVGLAFLLVRLLRR